MKYEEVHLKAYADGREARAGIGSWMNFYNHRRPHQAMNNQTPMAAWRAGRKRLWTCPAASLYMDNNAGALPTCPQPPQQQTSDLGLTEAGNGAGFHLERPIPWPQEPGPPLVLMSSSLGSGALRLV